MRDLLLYLIITLENCFILACFTFLAYHFNHWWISLFSILCFTTITTKQKEREEKK